jgi:hypothetical protein
MSICFSNQKRVATEIQVVDKLENPHDYQSMPLRVIFMSQLVLLLLLDSPRLTILVLRRYTARTLNRFNTRLHLLNSA